MFRYSWMRAFLVLACSEVSLSRFVSLRKNVFLAVFFEKILVLTDFDQMKTPPPNIHRWKAMDLSFPTVFLTCQPSDFWWRLRTDFLDDSRLCHKQDSHRLSPAFRSYLSGYYGGMAKDGNNLSWVIEQKSFISNLFSFPQVTESQNFKRFPGVCSRASSSMLWQSWFSQNPETLSFFLFQVSFWGWDFLVDCQSSFVPCCSENIGTSLQARRIELGQAASYIDFI